MSQLFLDSLKLSGLEPIAAEFDYYVTMMKVATGQMSKDELAAWLQTAVKSVDEG